MTLEEVIQSRLDRLVDIPTGFSDSMIEIQKKAFDAILKQLGALETDSLGNIIVSNKNYAKIESILAELQKGLYSSGYLKEVKSFIAEFQPQIALNNTILKSLDSAFSPSKQMELAFEQSRRIATETLTDYFSEQLKAQVRTILNQSVQSSSTFTEMIKNVKGLYEGSGGTEGYLERYAKQQSYDLFTITDAQYAMQGNDELGIEFYEYKGSTKDTTRAFCEERHGKIFHRKEWEQWAVGEKCCGLKWPQNNTWAGKNKDTNKATIFSLRGGWLCGHVPYGVDTRYVPKDVLERAKKAGYYKPKKEKKGG